MKENCTSKSRLTRTSAFLLCLLLWGVQGAWAGDGVVALQSADPSCADPTNPDRYIDCGNGTVTDNDTGLVWLADADCLDGFFDWFTAMEFVAGLSDVGVDPDGCGLSDGSSPGEWRLPSKAEWQAMAEKAVVLGCSPSITNDAGNSCWGTACVTAGACSFSGVVLDYYWSASNYVGDPSNAWFWDLYNGNIGRSSKTFRAYVWPVRGGQ